ncbi:hypothetical protein INR49_032209 [Caranx melampygus]|nr:hypothetical protein INR49_032209 [Caranx melampygus]
MVRSGLQGSAPLYDRMNEQSHPQSKPVQQRILYLFNNNTAIQLLEDTNREMPREYSQQRLMRHEAVCGFCLALTNSPRFEQKDRGKPDRGTGQH